MSRTRLSFALIVAGALSLASCSSLDAPTGPDTEPSTLLSGGGGLLGTSIGSGLLACDSLPYASASATIGATGGTLVIGPHRLVVPAGALAAPTLIRGEAPVGPVASVKLQPEGLRFATGKPARLTLSYASCPLLGSLLPKRIAYTTDLLAILSFLPSLDDLLGRTVTAPLEHFSRYAVAW
ncbi:MAG TPA: hypothetical protein VFJ50_05410 [Gemmatimonadales bacterium]|nr:hypothetical protein [Gemmatimonadales bacterium]